MSANPARAVPAIAPFSEPPAQASTAQLSIQQGVIPAPPEAGVRPRVDRIHADIRVDEYAWLRDRDDPAVLAYLEAENRYTEAVMRPSEELQDRLFEEMRARIKETDLSVPEPLDDWLYYSRTEAGAQYPIYCRRRARRRLGGRGLCSISTRWPRARIIFRLGAFEVSPTIGSSPGRPIPAAPSRSPCGLRIWPPARSWGAVGNLRPAWPGPTTVATLFYVVLDSAARPCRLYRHRLGDDPAAGCAALLRGRRVLLPRRRSHAEPGVPPHGAHGATPLPRCGSPAPTVRRNRSGGGAAAARHRSRVGHHGDRFLITTNDEAPNFRLVSAPVSDTSKELDPRCCRIVRR